MARWTLTGLQNGGYYALEGIAITLQNPNIRKHKFLKIFMYLFIVSFILLGLTNVLVTIPIQVLRLILWVFASGNTTQVDDMLESSSRLIRETVAYIPFLALMLMRYVYPKPLDDLFMESLRYIDTMHPNRPPYASILSEQKFKRKYWNDIKEYSIRTWKKVRIGLLLLVLSFLPVVGKFVFPAAGAYTTYKALGKTQAVVVGICFFFLPAWSSRKLIRALIGMRALMRELLAPYFVRMRMSHKEKRQWFSGRKDVLFGFSAIAYLIIRIPFIGVIGYGIAQAASAYMLTVVTDPPTKELFKKRLDENGDSVDKLEVTKSSDKKQD